MDHATPNPQNGQFSPKKLPTNYLRETLPKSGDQHTQPSFKFGGEKKNGFNTQSANQNIQIENNFARTITFNRSPGSVNTFGKNQTNYSDSQNKNQLQNKLPSFKNDAKENSISAFDKIEMKSRISQLEEEIQHLKETQLKGILANTNSAANFPMNDVSGARANPADTDRLGPLRQSEALNSDAQPLSLGQREPKMPKFGEYDSEKNHLESFERANQMKTHDSSISKYLHKGDSNFFSGQREPGRGFFDSINSSFYHELRPKEPLARVKPIREHQELYNSKEKIKEQENQIKLLNERISQLERASQSQAEYLRQKTSLLTSSIPVSPQRRLSPMISRDSTHPKLELLPTSQSIHMKTTNPDGLYSQHMLHQPQSEYSYMQTAQPQRAQAHRASREYTPMNEYMSTPTQYVKNIVQKPVRRVYHKDEYCPRISHGETEIVTSSQMNVIGSLHPQRRSRAFFLKDVA